MLTLYKLPADPIQKESRFIVKWCGYPIGVISETDMLPHPLRYQWVKNSEFGPCSHGTAASLEDTKAQFKRFWCHCLDSLGLAIKSPPPS